MYDGRLFFLKDSHCMHNYLINDRLLSVHLHVRTFSHLAVRSDNVCVCLCVCVCVFLSVKYVCESCCLDSKAYVSTLAKDGGSDCDLKVCHYSNFCKVK